MRTRVLLRFVPPQIKAWLWRVIDRTGAWPQQIKAGPARGLTLIAPIRRGISYCSGTYEPHVMATLAKVVSPGMVVCDVGSHLGYYTLALAQLVGLSGHVFAFEPLPKHAALLQRTLARNRLKQVTVVPQAVGAEMHLAGLEEWPNDAMTRIINGSPSPWATQVVEVPVTTLDDWASQRTDIRRVDLIKLDIEGQELAALRGAAGLLAQHHPQIVCEIHCREDVPYRPQQIVTWLQRAGYKVELIQEVHHTSDTLQPTLERLEAISTSMPPGWMAVAHILARSRQ